MSPVRSRPRLRISRHGPNAKLDQHDKDLTLLRGCLTPELQPITTPVLPEQQYKVYKIGKFILQQVEGETYRACDSLTRDEKVCKVFEINKYRESLSAYWQVDSHENISCISEIILGQTKAYVFFERHYGDLHSYVRQKKRLEEDEASHLFYQIVKSVKHCHDNGIVLRDLKLRKFVFKNKERTELRLDSLEDACVLENENDDHLSDKRGCPAYVSPEILNGTPSYSGRAADMWSLGVMLYTMIVGRYPFHDKEPSMLFKKIIRGQYSLPPSVSPKANCLIKSILRLGPRLRLSAEECLCHPWLDLHSKSSLTMCSDFNDQIVPNVVLRDYNVDWFT